MDVIGFEDFKRIAGKYANKLNVMERQQLITGGKKLNDASIVHLTP